MIGENLDEEKKKKNTAAMTPKNRKENSRSQSESLWKKLMWRKSLIKISSYLETECKNNKFWDFFYYTKGVR